MPLARRRRFRKAKGKPTAYDRKQDRKISKIYKMIETKRHDVDQVPASIVSTTPRIELLNGIAQDSSSLTRVGLKFSMSSIFLRWSAIYADGTNFIRAIILYDNMTDGAAPVEADIVETPGEPLSPLKYNNRKRFHVLWDKMINLSAQGTGAITGKKYLKVPSKYRSVICTGTGATVASIQKGSLYMFIMSDSTATSHPSFGYYLRLKYQDL